jgi:hypothetical protein
MYLRMDILSLQPPPWTSTVLRRVFVVPKTFQYCVYLRATILVDDVNYTPNHYMGPKRANVVLRTRTPNHVTS